MAFRWPPVAMREFAKEPRKRNRESFEVGAL
jgi:hypothetical protein